MRLALVTTCFVFLDFLRGDGGGDVSEGEDKGDMGLGERALFPLDLDLVEVEVAVASLTAELIMAGMVAEIAASRASLIDEMTGLRF